MCENRQLISEDLVEVLNNLILNLFLCYVAYAVICKNDVLIDVIDVKEEHERAENCSLCAPRKRLVLDQTFPHQEQLSDF